MSSVGSGASPTRLRIGVDAMGSDRGCEPVVLGVRLALKNVAAEVERFILAGDEAVLRPLLRRNKRLGTCRTPPYTAKRRDLSCVVTRRLSPPPPSIGGFGS